MNGFFDGLGIERNYFYIFDWGWFFFCLERVVLDEGIVLRYLFGVEEGRGRYVN